MITNPNDFRFLDRLLTMAPRKKYDDGSRHEPFWKPTNTPRIYKDCVTPTWGWERPAPLGKTLVTVDANGAFLAAATSGTYAHSALTQTGRQTAGTAPGYYLIEAPAWNVKDLPSPLGTTFVRPRAWVAQPTLGLLREVERTGHMGHAQILDSWTAPVTWTMRPWAESIRDERVTLMDALDAAGLPCTNKTPAYRAFKDAYSMAVQMWLGKLDRETGEHTAAKSKVLRPDWYHTLHAQHAASFWRPAFKAWLSGSGPYSMYSPDQLTYSEENWSDVTGGAKPVYRTDQTGRQLGRYKIKDA